MNRGDIWYVDLGGRAGKRPVVVLTRQADNIHTVPKKRLVKYSGTLDPATMVKISRKVILALGLDEVV